MGIFIGIGNYIGRKNTFLTNKDPSNIYYNLITEEGGNILTEMYNLILRDLNNIASEDSLIIISEDGRVIIRDEFVQPIASYRTYDKTNDDTDRDVLTDLTGNGHDIQLYNFAFAESSGYGKYATDFTNWISGIGVIRQSDKFIITTEYTGNAIMYFYTNTVTYDIPSFTVKISGLNFHWTYKYVNEDGVIVTFNLQEGINKLPISHVSLYSGDRTWIGFSNVSVSSITNNVIVEQIPEYQGALVSDGVDDYGLCKNFPILTKEKGYTVLMIRKILSNTGFYVFTNSSGVTASDGFCQFENVKLFTTRSYGRSGYVKFAELFSYQTTNKYNNKLIDSYNHEAKDKIGLFCHDTGSKGRYATSVALYALEIYDRDLTDEEIVKVKARMIAEYEEKTGNKYEEETA